MILSNSGICCQDAFSSFRWHPQNGMHSDLLLAHFQFSNNAFWQMEVLILSVILTVLSNWSCHFGKNLQSFLCHLHSSGFWYSTLDCASAHIHLPCRAAHFVCSISPIRDGGIARRLGSARVRGCYTLQYLASQDFYYSGRRQS